jgi:hypothetical protein
MRNLTKTLRYSEVYQNILECIRVNKEELKTDYINNNPLKKMAYTVILENLLKAKKNYGANLRSSHSTETMSKIKAVLMGNKGKE